MKRCQETIPVPGPKTRCDLQEGHQGSHRVVIPSSFTPTNEPYYIWWKPKSQSWTGHGSFGKKKRREVVELPKEQGTD